jgi:hypothetical protein
MTPEELLKFKQELKEAVESGIGEDWGYDGEDEYPFDTFDANYSTEKVIELLDKWGLLPRAIENQK